jgi:hypothetical protein
LITHVFEPMARLEANSLGMGNLPLVILPHPVGTLPKPLARALVDSALERLVGAITKLGAVRA